MRFPICWSNRANNQNPTRSNRERARARARARISKTY